MTYLDLLVRIKNNAQPTLIEFAPASAKRPLYFVWDGTDYKRGMLADGANLKDHLSEIDMVNANCIRALKYEEDGDDDISGSASEN